MKNFLEFKNKEILEDNLVKDIISILKQSILENGKASMLVSGGSTPKKLFLKLSKENLDWQNVDIGLVDERFVASTSSKSNEKLLKENLLINKAKRANFVSLIYQLDDRKANLEIANRKYKSFDSQLDICLLGMGKDGHTASLFPKDKSSLEALSSNEKHLLVNTNADVEPFERISSSNYLIQKSDNLFLMMTGEEKKEVLSKAKEKSLPVATFFKTTKTELIIYYSKN